MIRKTVLALLVLLGCCTVAAAATPAESASAELRAMALAVQPAQIGLTREAFGKDVWGVVMETGTDAGYYTLVVLGDGSTSLYLSTGGGVIGAGEHEAVRVAGAGLIAEANKHLAAAATSDGFPPPADGDTTFHLLTFDGPRSRTAPTNALGEDKDALSPLFHAAHEVIMQVRLASQ